jgi:pimeloyl-ACP methyl ester carboxylesterase
MKSALAIALPGLILLALGLGPHAPAAEPPAPPARKSASESLQLTIPAGVLHGTLDLPTGPGPFPVVILLAGSGPTDRDGNQPGMKNDSLKQLGQALAERGVAVLRYDRRGVAQSAAAAPKEEEFRLEMLADDAAAWVKLLRRDRRFRHVALAGHSEGALVGLLAAQRALPDAFISLASPGRPAAKVLRDQLSRNLSGERKDKALRILDELAAGRPVAEVPKELAGLFRPSVQPYLRSLFRYDPAREIARLTVPVLVIQGTTDLQESVEDARLLAAARPGARLELVEGMNHVLKRARTQVEQQLAYLTPGVAVMPEVADKVSAFLRDLH